MAKLFADSFSIDGTYLMDQRHGVRTQTILICLLDLNGAGESEMLLPAGQRYNDGCSRRIIIALHHYRRSISSLLMSASLRWWRQPHSHNVATVHSDRSGELSICCQASSLARSHASISS